MNTVTMRVVRADDLFALDFDCVNTILNSQGSTPRLERDDPTKPVLLVVRFAPQAFAERGFSEDGQGFLVDLLPPPIPSAMAHPSRLVFSVPDALLPLPLTLDSLLAWTQYDPVLAANALPDPPGAHNGPRPAVPSAQTTAIDAPYGLIVSPDRFGLWAHAVLPVTHDGRTELWHTRLGTRRGGAIDEMQMPTVRAVAADHGRDYADVLFGRALLPPLTFADRAAIASASSDFSLNPSPPPLRASRLMLSPLGAWTDLTGDWGQRLGPSPDIVGWRHLTTMGRDQRVHLVSLGYLYPFRHRAALIKIAERRIVPSPSTGEPVAYLAVRRFIVVQELEQSYGVGSGLQAAYVHAAREMPISRVRILTVTTPNLDASATGDAPFFPVEAGGEDVQFRVQAEDADGAAVQLTTPMMFVPLAQSFDLDPLRAIYLSAPVARRRADLRGQPVAFAAGAAGDATLATTALQFDAVVPTFGTHPPYLPTIDSAQVSIPAIDHLFGSAATSGATTISLHGRYLQHAFDPENNRGQVFVRTATPVDLRMPADRSGGLATPRMSVDGLSRHLGPVSGVDQIADGLFDPVRAFASVDAKLLGAIALKDLIQAVTAGAPGPILTRNVPRLIQKRTPDALTTSYSWTPDVKELTAPSVLETRPPKTTLTLRVESTLPLRGSAAPSSLISGVLTDFTLNLLKVIKVTFARIAFESREGRKMDLRAEGIGVEFTNELRFVAALAKVLPARGFSDGPTITVGPKGISSGYSIGIPTAGIGAFSLANVALSASLFLPLVDEPAGLRLAFSSREHPFLVTLSMIGGGGFLAIELTAAGMRLIEGALEVGGNITLGLGIISANAQVMAGFYFGITKTATEMTFVFTAYIRVGGSVEILGLVAVSVDVYIGLSYHPTPSPGVIEGKAGVTVGVRVLFFSKSITLEIGCTFDIDTGKLVLRSFDEMLSEDDWTQYCRAFA